jgi:hypothetical protein
LLVVSVSPSCAVPLIVGAAVLDGEETVDAGGDADELTYADSEQALEPDPLGQLAGRLVIFVWDGYSEQCQLPLLSLSVKAPPVASTAIQ